MLKFGGSSVATAARWKKIEQIVREHLDDGRTPIVVCSALKGVTDLLVGCIRAINDGARPDAQVGQIVERHRALGEALDFDPMPLLKDELAALDDELAAPGPVTADRHARVLTFGERMSTRMGAHWLGLQGLSAAWLDVREILVAEDEEIERDERYLSARCCYDPDSKVRERLAGMDAQVFITQGFAARNSNGETVVLGRGGSDTSAAYLAALLDAERLDIWTDVPGMFTANPHAISGARLLRRLTYAEAEALGALGAKVLHPRCIEPVAARGIPVRLGWTDRPEIDGTRINVARTGSGTKAIAARDKLRLIDMRRPSSWQPVGFMAEVADCFRRRGLSMDLISTSPSSIMATVDLAAFPSAEEDLEDLLADLSKTCEPRDRGDVSCVSLVGAGVGDDILQSAEVLAPFAKGPVFMMSAASNGTHVSFVVESNRADELVEQAHAAMFGDVVDSAVFGPAWSEIGVPDTGDAYAPRIGLAVSPPGDDR